MYAYVGNAKMRPDSFTPRRLTSVMKARIARQINTRESLPPANCGIETIAATPAEIDTATVRM